MVAQTPRRPLCDDGRRLLRRRPVALLYGVVGVTGWSVVGLLRLLGVL